MGRVLRWPLWIQISLGAVLGLLLGWLLRPEGAEGARNFILPGLELVAAAFLKLLRMCVVPLVVSSIFIGVTSVSQVKSLGRLGLKTASYYIVSSLLAITTGFAFVNLISPGKGATIQFGDYSPGDMDLGEASLSGFILSLIPANPLAAMSGDPPDMLGLIFFTLVFSVFAVLAGGKVLAPLQKFIGSVFDVMLAVVQVIIKIAPLAVFALIAELVATSELGIFKDLAWYLLTVSGALLFHLFVVLPLAYFLFTKKNPYVYLGHLSPALLTGFSSASSAATLPLTMECVEKRAKVPGKVSSLVLPLGATVNMDGTALYEGVAVLFIAQALGVQLDFLQQLTVFFLALMISIGAASIPHAGLVMMVTILQAVNLPIEAVGIIFAVDRLVDMTRTSVNIWSDSVGAAIIAHSERKYEAEPTQD